MFHLSVNKNIAEKCADILKCQHGGEDQHYTSIEAARYSASVSTEVDTAFTLKSEASAIVETIPSVNTGIFMKLVKDFNNKSLEHFNSYTANALLTVTKKEVYSKVKNKGGFPKYSSKIECTVHYPKLSNSLGELVGFGVFTPDLFELKALRDLSAFPTVYSESCAGCSNPLKLFILAFLQNEKISFYHEACVPNEKESAQKIAIYKADLQAYFKRKSKHRQSSKSSSAYRTLDVLALALAIVEKHNYASAKFAVYDASTAFKVKEILTGKNNNIEIITRASELEVFARKLIASELSRTNKNEFGQTLESIIRSDYVDDSKINILVGLSKTYEKILLAKAEINNFVPAAVGASHPIGKKFENKDFTVISCDKLQLGDRFAYAGFKTSYRVVMRDEDNYEYIWWAPNKVTFKPNDLINFKRAKVKKTIVDARTGNEQTVLFYCALGL